MKREQNQVLSMLSFPSLKCGFLQISSLRAQDGCHTGLFLSDKNLPQNPCMLSFTSHWPEGCHMPTPKPITSHGERVTVIALDLLVFIPSRDGERGASKQSWGSAEAAAGRYLCGEGTSPPAPTWHCPPAPTQRAGWVSAPALPLLCPVIPGKPQFPRL